MKVPGRDRVIADRITDKLFKTERKTDRQKDMRVKVNGKKQTDRKTGTW